MKMTAPELCAAFDKMLGVDSTGLRPSVWDMTEEGEMDAGGAFGPALDPELNPVLKGK